MAKFVGVTDILMLQNEALAKRAALIFDNLCFSAISTTRWLETRIVTEKLNPLRNLLAKHDWLLEKGVTVAAPSEFGSDAITQEVLDWTFSNPELLHALEPMMSRLRDPHGAELVEGARSRISRRAALRLEAQSGWETAVFEHGAGDAPLFATGTNSVAQVVLESIPVPDDSTAWEEIIEYRSDPESRTRFHRLKHWINGMVAQNRSPHELSDEIQTLIAEYEHHMKVHHMKLRAGVLETFVTASAEILEGLVKIKWSDAARTLFSVRRRRIQLMEEELRAPGRQLAYLSHVRHRFRRKRSD